MCRIVLNTPKLESAQWGFYIDYTYKQINVIKWLHYYYIKWKWGTAGKYNKG